MQPLMHPIVCSGVQSFERRAQCDVEFADWAALETYYLYRAGVDKSHFAWFAVYRYGARIMKKSTIEAKILRNEPILLNLREDILLKKTFGLSRIFFGHTRTRGDLLRSVPCVTV